MKCLENKKERIRCHFEAEPKDEKENKSAVILSPKVGVGISGASAESVVGDVIKTNRYSAQRDLYTHSLRSGFKMTMPMLTLSLVLSLVVVNEAWAVTCTDNQTCGTDCCWVIENGTLKITGNEAGTGVMEGYQPEGQPWYSQRNSITAVEVSGVQNLGMRAFQYLRNVSSVTLSDSVKSIGNRAFFETGQNVMIDNLILPKNLTTIANYAFFNAHGIRSITIPDSVTSIGGQAGGVTFYAASSLTTINISETLSAENVAKWSVAAFNGASNLVTINCLKADGSAGGDESKCMAAMARFLTDEDGNCQEGITCIQTLQKMNNKCVGQYFASTANDGTCVKKSACTDGGENVVNLESRQCMSKADCTGTYSIDEENNHCNKIAGCSSFANGACSCEKYYYQKEGGCVYFKDGCGSGWLEKNSVCINASNGCGEGYKDMGGYCNRVRYTPAEAAAVLKEDGNEFTITFKK